MTNIQLDLEVQPRTTFGKNSNRRLRADGQIPAVVYGGERDPAPIQLSARTLGDLMRNAGDNAIFLLKLAGTKKVRHVMIKEHQIDAISGKTIHLDFQRIDLDQKVVVTVAVELEGTPEGVRKEGGVLDFVTREIEIECLPTQIPSTLVVDVSELGIGDHVEVSNLVVPEGVEILDDPGRTIAAVAIPQEIEEEPEEEEEGLLIEGEGEEPERIGRTREEEGEEGEAEAEAEAEG